MNRDWKVVAWDPNTSDRDLWTRYHRYRRVRSKENDPSSPVNSDATTERHLTHPSEWSIDHRYLALEGNQVVGSLIVMEARPDAAGYESNKHIVRANFAVQSDHRRQGIGSHFLGIVADHMDQVKATVLTVHSSEPDGQAFCEFFGAELKQVERVSRLYLDNVDWEQMGRWESAIETRAPGTTLETYPDRLPKSFLEEYCPALQEMMNLMPWDDMDHGDIEITPEEWEKTYERLALTGDHHHTVISREPDGTISAITDLSWGPEHPELVWQWFTGVHPSYRGKGLGKAIKAAMLRYVHERHPNVEYISTGNAASNESMLAINERMGFRQHKRYHSYQIGPEALKSYLDSRS